MLPNQSFKPKTSIFDSETIFIQSFDADHNDEIVSTSRSNFSHKSKHLSAIMNNLTVSSYKKVTNVAKSHFSTHNRQECQFQLQSLKIKSNTPAIEFQSSIFSHWSSGWLLKKHDVDSTNKILINKYHKVSLITYDTFQYNYVLKADLLSNTDIFASCVAFHANCPDNLLYYYDLKSDSVGMFDYNKSILIDSIQMHNHQVTAVKAINNLVCVGGNNKVLVYDLRCNRQAYEIRLKGDKFNPVTGIEVNGDQVLIASKSSIDIGCVKKNGLVYTINRDNKENKNGISKAKFYVNDSNNKIVIGQVGSRFIQIHDTNDLKANPNIIELNKKLLSLDTNNKEGEICVIEGSSNLKLNFYSEKFGKVLDSIDIDNSTVDFELNKDKESCICFSDKKCAIYSFRVGPVEIADNIEIPKYE